MGGGHRHRPVRIGGVLSAGAALDWLNEPADTASTILAAAVAFAVWFGPRWDNAWQEVQYERSKRKREALEAAYRADPGRLEREARDAHMASFIGPVQPESRVGTQDRQAESEEWRRGLAVQTRRFRTAFDQSPTAPSQANDETI